MAEASLNKAGPGAVTVVDVSSRCARLLGQLCVANSPIDPRAIRALNFLTDSVDVSGSTVNLAPGALDVSDRCNRQLGTLCFGGIPIDPRAIRALTFLTDSVDVSGSTVNLAPGALDVSDRCTRLLGTLCSGGVAIDPRDRNWDLDFASDQVDASGSTVTATITGTPDVNVTDREEREVGLVTMKDAFMELRLMADYLKDIPMAIDPNTSRVRTNVETGSLTGVTTVTTVTTVSTLSNISNIGNVPASSFIYDTMDIVWNTGIRPQIV